MKMLHVDLGIGGLDSHLVRRWLAGDNRALQELAEGFWDRQFLRKFFDQIRIPITPPPPDPSPELRFEVQNAILSETLIHLAGDPDPEPNRGRHLIAALRDPQIRLKSAKSMHAGFVAAAKAIEAEIGDKL
jgi:hypothetical protein